MLPRPQMIKNQRHLASQQRRKLVNSQVRVGNAVSYTEARVLLAMPVYDKGVHAIMSADVGVAEVQFLVDHTIDYAPAHVLVKVDFFLDK